MKNRKRNRMQGFDYSKDAIYFLTTCTKKRVHYFGEIKDGIMHLNEYGKIAQNQIAWLAKQYPYVDIHHFVVMPNHIHLLIEINRNYVVVDADADAAVGTGRDLSLSHNNNNNNKLSTDNFGTDKLGIDKMGIDNLGTDNLGLNHLGLNHLGLNHLGTGRDLSLRGENIKIKSISSLMGAYKTTSSKEIHKMGNPNFNWQRSFHDHIVRNEKRYNIIFNYITDNPKRWKEDTFNITTNPNFDENE